MLCIYHEPWCKAQRLEATCRAGSAQFENSSERAIHIQIIESMVQVEPSGESTYLVAAFTLAMHHGFRRTSWSVVSSSPAAVLTAADLHQKKKELKIDRICCTAPLKPGDDLGSGLAYHFPSLKKSLLDCKV